MDDRDMIPAAGEPPEALWPDGPTRPDMVLTGALPPDYVADVSGPTTIAAEWALWGKEAHETGAHVLRCSDGGLRGKDFAEVITRYSLGDLAVLPQYTVSWIPAANREPEYVVIGIHELAPADPGHSDGRSRRDAAGRAIVFVRLFCLRYADLAELSVSYQDLVVAADQVELPAANAGPVTLTLPDKAMPIYRRGTPHKLAEGVAALLLTNHPVCVLGADDVGVAERLRFIDTVMALLPYGLRATMSAGTWADSTAQDLKLRLFFAGAPPARDRLADARRTTEDRVVDWANTSAIQVTGEAALLYQEWLKDVRDQAPDLLAEQTSPVRFHRADLRRMVGSLPKDKGIEETLDELGESLLRADKAAIRTAIKRLRRYLASGQRPADLTGYQRRVRAGHLLANDDRLSAQLKGDLYGVLLPVAFGSPLTYAGYCAVEECASVPLHTSLRTALTRCDTADPLTWILAHDYKPGSRSDKPLDELHQQLGSASAAEPLEYVVRAVAAQQLRPSHGPILLDFALRYLNKFSHQTRAVLVRYGYLASVYEYIFGSDLAPQVAHLTWALAVVFGVPLSKPDINAVLRQPPTAALYRAVLETTDRRDHGYVEERVSAAVRRLQGLPDRPAPVRQGRRWTSGWPLPGRRRHGGHRPSAAQPQVGQPEFSQPPELPVRLASSARPGTAATLPVSHPRHQPTELGQSSASVWRHPRTTYGAVVVILVLCFVAYLVLQHLLLTG